MKHLAYKESSELVHHQKLIITFLKETWNFLVKCLHLNLHPEAFKEFYLRSEFCLSMYNDHFT